jgi:hypothetical protein
MTRMSCFDSIHWPGHWLPLPVGRLAERSLASARVCLRLLRMAIFVLSLVALGPLRTPLWGSNAGNALYFRAARARVLELHTVDGTRSMAPTVLTCTVDDRASESDDDSDDPSSDPIVGFEASGSDAARCYVVQTAVCGQRQKVSLDTGRPSEAPEPPPPRAT